MTDIHPAWRIGGLSYLNTRPLVCGIEDRITAGEPSQMADLMRRGELDAAIVPVAEVLAEDRYDVLDGIAIGSRGPVRSVFVAHRGIALARVKRVAITPVSRTSVWLLRILLKKCHGSEPEFYPKGPKSLLCDHEAMLLIGDEALEYSLRAPTPRRHIWDLGEAWQTLTGLPFVYAVWAMQKGARGAPLQKMLRAAKAAGLARLDELAARPGLGTPEFRREYLTRHVCYDLGDAEKRGLQKFQEWCAELKMIPAAREVRYVS